MNNVHQKRFKKTKFYKNYTIPIVLFLDQIGLLSFFIPLVNKLIKFVGIKKRFNSKLNYRIYADSFEGAFSSQEDKPSKTALFFFTMGSESSFLLRQLIIAKYLESLNWKVEFLVCSGNIIACNKERIGKSKENSAFMCRECSWGYTWVKKQTGIQMNTLNIAKLKPSDLKKIENIKTLEECENYTTEDNAPLGRIAKKNVLRYFYQGSLMNNKKELSVFKKYLAGSLQTVRGLNHYFSDKKPDLIIMMNGVGNLDQSMIYQAEKLNIDYITQEVFYGSNSWVFKKNGIAIHLNYMKEWMKYGVKLNVKEKKELHNFLDKIKKGKVFQTKMHDSEIGPISLDKGVTLFTNMNFDTYVLGRNSLFKSMENWLIETIEFWKENVKDIPLYIRAHPGEVKTPTPAIRFVRDIVKPHLNENIILIDSDSEINSYSLIKKSKYVITYASTVGAESMMQGVPCICAGEAFYKSFAIVPKNTSEYFDKLLKMNFNPKQDIDIDNLESFLHYLYMKRIFQFEGFDINRGDSKIDLSNLSKYENLIEQNKSILDSFYQMCVING